MKISKTYVKAAEGLSSRQRQKIAKNSTDPKELSRLAYDNSESVRFAVLNNENTPQKVVDYLCNEFIESPDWRNKYKAVTHTADPQFLRRLIDDSDHNIRKAVASNPHITESLLDILSNDPDKWVKVSVARATNDESLLTKLASDPESVVRCAAIENIKDPDLLRLLANDMDSETEYGFACNPNTPLDIMLNLAKTGDNHLREDMSYEVKYPEILDYLSNDSNVFVRIRVSKNPATSLETLNKLANDSNANVRWEVASRIEDVDILNQLALDFNSKVRSSALHRLKELYPLKKTNSRPKKPTKTDWSIPLYSIQNYSDIESEIDDVIDQAANQYAQKYFGTTADVVSPEGVYDSNGQIQIVIGNDRFTIDAEDILPPATSKNLKKDCVKTLITWMENNLK